MDRLIILRYDLEQITHIEEYVSIPSIEISLDSNVSWKYIDIWKIRSVYIHQHKEKISYRLHPELVHKNLENGMCTYIYIYI